MTLAYDFTFISLYWQYIVAGIVCYISARFFYTVLGSKYNHTYGDRKGENGEDITFEGRFVTIFIKLFLNNRHTRAKTIFFLLIWVLGSYIIVKQIPQNVIINIYLNKRNDSSNFMDSCWLGYQT